MGVIDLAGSFFPLLFKGGERKHQSRCRIGKKISNSFVLSPGRKRNDPMNFLTQPVILLSN